MAKKRKSSKSDAPKRSDLSAVSAQISKIDNRLLDLVVQRKKLVERQRQAVPGHVEGAMEQSNQALQEVVRQRENDPMLASDEATDLLKHVASVCLLQPSGSPIVFLGPRHSYSHLATIKYFGDATIAEPVASIAAVFEALVNLEARVGVVPIENSTDGRVVDTLGMFVTHPVKICGEVLMAIHHNLLSRTARESIVEVHSKPQALSQCRGWLARHLPYARLVEVGSTATAAISASKKKGVAAVASLEAGRAYGLDVLDRNIEDNANNVTRFAILGRELPDPSGQDKTALLFQVDHQPGALADVMALFKRRKLNLTWIESFPVQGSSSEYLFFIEAEGHNQDPLMAGAIAALRKRALRLEVLGAYRRGTLFD